MMWFSMNAATYLKSNMHNINLMHSSGVFRTFELRVLTVIDVPKLRVLKGGDSNRLSKYYGC